MTDQPTTLTKRDVQVFVVRKQASGYSSSVRYKVVRKATGGRVQSGYDHTEQSAQAAADQLNIGELVRPWTLDPRPYEERLAEAERIYREAVSNG